MKRCDKIKKKNYEHHLRGIDIGNIAVVDESYKKYKYTEYTVAFRKGIDVLFVVNNNYLLALRRISKIRQTSLFE